MLLSSFEFLLAQILFISFQMCLNVSEFTEQMVVFQNLEIFDVEVGFVTATELLLWLSWIDAFKNA